MINRREHAHGEWYDRGGSLPTGIGTLTCELAKPEPILTERQWDDLRRSLDQK